VSGGSHLEKGEPMARTRARTRWLAVVVAASALSVGCAKNTTTAVPTSNQPRSETTDGNRSATTRSGRSDTTRSGRSSTSGDANELVETGRLSPSDVGSNWKRSEPTTGPAAPPNGEVSENCPFLNAFLDGVEKQGSAGEFKNEPYEVTSHVWVYEDEAAARAALDLRRRAEDEGCTVDELRSSLEKQSEGSVTMEGKLEDGKGGADEEVVNRMSFTTTSRGIPLQGGTLFITSRVGKVLVVTNLKNTNGSTVGPYPRFLVEPLQRLRDAGA
jgi:hypothetical protein